MTVVDPLLAHGSAYAGADSDVQSVKRLFA